MFSPLEITQTFVYQAAKVTHGLQHFAISGSPSRLQIAVSHTRRLATGRLPGNKKRRQQIRLDFEMRRKISWASQVHDDRALPGLNDAVHGTRGDPQVVLLGGKRACRKFDGILSDTKEISQCTQRRDHDGTRSPQADLAGNIRFKAHREKRRRFFRSHTARFGMSSKEAVQGRLQQMGAIAPVHRIDSAAGLYQG